MKLSDLACPATTEYEFVNPATDEPSGVVITGYTPDSSEYKKIEKSVVGPVKKQEVTIGKKGRQQYELDSRDFAANQLEIIIRITTGIRGIDNWEFSTAAVRELFENPAYTAIYEQWVDHLNDRASFFRTPATRAKRGPKA